MKKQPRGIRNNNPGNIRQSAVIYKGEINPSQDPAFKQFISMEYGYRAMFVLLYTYQKRHGLCTLSEMIRRYAPPEDSNHTQAYIDNVARSSGTPANNRIETMSKNIMVPIVAAMSQVENGIPAVLEEVQAGWNLFLKR